MIRLETRDVIELHSLARYPPIGLDAHAGDELDRVGLVVCTRRPIPEQQTGRYRLTARGKVVLRQTARFCRVPHCPCHGGKLTSDAVEDLVDRFIGVRLGEV